MACFGQCPLALSEDFSTLMQGIIYYYSFQILLGEAKAYRGMEVGYGGIGSWRGSENHEIKVSLGYTVRAFLKIKKKSKINVKVIQSHVNSSLHT